MPYHCDQIWGSFWYVMCLNVIQYGPENQPRTKPSLSTVLAWSTVLRPKPDIQSATCTSACVGSADAMWWTSAAYRATLSNTNSPPITDKWAGHMWAELRNITRGRAFSFASPYLRMLLAFGSENDRNSNCSSLAWSASCPSSSYKLYPRSRDKRMSRNAVTGKTHAASASEMHISLHDYSGTSE